NGKHESAARLFPRVLVMPSGCAAGSGEPVAPQAGDFGSPIDWERLVYSITIGPGRPDRGAIPRDETTPGADSNRVVEVEELADSCTHCFNCDGRHRRTYSYNLSFASAIEVVSRIVPSMAACCSARNICHFL